MIKVLILVLDNRASANGGGTDFSAVDEVAVTVVERGDLRAGTVVFELHPQFKAVGAFGFEVGIRDDGIAVGCVGKRHGRAVKRRRAEALGISGKTGELLTHRHAQAQAGRKRGIVEAGCCAAGIGVEIGLVGFSIQLVFLVTQGRSQDDAVAEGQTVLCVQAEGFAFAVGEGFVRIGAARIDFADGAGQVVHGQAVARTGGFGMFVFSSGNDGLFDRAVKLPHAAPIQPAYGLIETIVGITGRVT